MKKIDEEEMTLISVLAMLLSPFLVVGKLINEIEKSIASKEEVNQLPPPPDKIEITKES